MAEHIHGKMDVTQQERAFDGLLRAVALVAAASFAILLFLALVNS